MTRVLNRKYIDCLHHHQLVHHSVMSNYFRPHGLQHVRLSCPSPTPGVWSNSCPLSWWCHPTISSSVVPLSFCLQSFPASESFPMSQFFASGGRHIRVSASASVLPMNIQDWSWSAWLIAILSLPLLPNPGSTSCSFLSDDIIVCTYFKYFSIIYHGVFY